MLSVIRQRRSIRKYLQKDIEKEKLNDLLKTAMFSPTARGLRPWEFIVVTNPEQYRVQCLMLIGYPEKQPEPHKDEEFEESRIHYEKF